MCVCVSVVAFESAREVKNGVAQDKQRPGVLILLIPEHTKQKTFETRSHRGERLMAIESYTRRMIH